ncbi:hypothetical protein CJ195_09180 [Bacillus sp. UMB0899]|nr:hypothetical protein CJ195_09180 [Bacillus sp. UMB0899]
MVLKSSILERVFFQSRIPQMIFEYNFKNNVANDAFFQFIGYSKDEWDELTLKEISHPEDHQLDMQLYHEVFTGKRPSYQMEKRYFHKSGEIIWGSLNVTAIEDPHSPKKYFLAQIYDITEQKNLERVLTDSEQKYRLLADNSSDIINLYLPDGKFMYCSPSITQILGYDTDELIGDVPYQYIHPDDISYVHKKHLSLLENRHPILITYRFKHKNDTYIWVESSIQSIADESTGRITGLLSISRDITSRLEKDKLLKKSEKLAVIGQLAAAVAHEIRNPLTSIKGFIQLFSQTKECNEGYMKIVQDELKRVEEIISEFLTMARPQQEKNEELDLDELIKQVITLLNTQANLENKEIKYKNAVVNPILKGDKSQLKHVFYQIIQNGLDALEEKGTVYVDMSADDDLLKVKITDNGRGISNERLKNIGEPYYSTKEKGTGLGLMTSFQIIENHHGKIEIDSIVGQGTSVSVTLPM